MAVARDQSMKKVERTHKVEVKKRLAKKKCDGELEKLQQEVEAMRTEQTNNKATLTELQTSIPNIKADLTTKIDELQKKVDSLSTDMNTKIGDIQSKVDQGCTQCKEETKKMIDELKTQVGVNKDNIQNMQSPFSKEMNENIMPNARVEGCFNLQGARQPLESWKYESAIKPVEKVNDPLVYNSVKGGNGGWSVISTRLGSNAIGVGIIDLQAEYYIKKFVVFGWGPYMQEVEIFQWNSESTPNFNEASTISNESNWKSMGKLTGLPETPRYPDEYTHPNNIDCEFKGRYVKTHSKASNIQVIAGIKAFGWKQ